MKKDYTESGYIEDVITRIALVNPNIAFKLINTGKTVIQTNGDGELKNVIYSIYGKDIANGIMEVNYKYEDLNIIGVIGKPEIARSNRSNQLFFVNKRYIKDKILTSATEQAYKGLIPIGKFGFAILNIEMNPAKVDVNVHPAKLEVRFEEENKVFQAIYHAIKDTLLKSELVANTEKKPEIDNPVFGTNRNLTFEERLKNIRENKKENTGGLFSFRKNAEKQIEDYTEQESKIKTNNILEDIYESKQKEKLVENISEKEQEKDEEKDIKSSVGEPINTADVLIQLRQMKEKLEKEVQSNSASSEEGVKEDSEAYKLQIEKETENENIEENKEQNKEQNEIIEKTSEAIENLKNQEINSEFKQIKQKMEKLQDTPQVVTEDFNEMYKKLFGTLPVQNKEELKKEQNNTAVDIIKENISMFENAEEYQKPVYKFIGIVFKTYIILEMNDEMYILDQHAAHERIMYEKVKQNYYSQKNKDSQMLLLPDIITLTHKEMDIAKENMKMFEQAGFSLEEFGENTIKLTGVPTVCIDLDTKELFLETLDEINTVARTAKQEKEEKFIATVACKAAVKANMALTSQEVESLMDKLLKLPNPFTCPHGRPTVIKMSRYDIERKFARK